MKLKTLKDLRLTDEHWVNRENLKAEAIKWVKFNEEAKEKNEKLPDRMGEHYGALNEGAIIFIKHFFNIIEEDLK